MSEIGIQASTTLRAIVSAISRSSELEVDPIVNLADCTSKRARPEGSATLQLDHGFRCDENSAKIPYSSRLSTFFFPRVGTLVFMRGRESRGDVRKAGPTFALIAADSEGLAAGAEVYVRVTRSFDMNIAWSRVSGGRYRPNGDELVIGVAEHRP